MPKFRKIGKSKRPSIIRADISYYSKGIRRAIKITYPADAEQRLTNPAKWNTLWQNEKMKLIVANATRQTTFTMEGEAVFFLIFRDGRRVRIYRDELSDRTGRRINGVIRNFLFPNNSRVRMTRQRTYKRARSKER